MAERDAQMEWTAIVGTPTGRETVRVTVRREYDPALDDWTVWHATVDHPAGEGHSAVVDKIEERAVLQALIYVGAAWRWRLVSLQRVEQTAWIPWPTREGAWWFRWTTSLLAEPCVARRAGNGFFVERRGVEGELFPGCDDLSAGVEFCPVEPPR